MHPRAHALQEEELRQGEDHTAAERGPTCPRLGKAHAVVKTQHHQNEAIAF